MDACERWRWPSGCARLVFDDIQQSENKRPPKVKVSARSIYTRQRAIPSVKFEADSQMTSFGGLVIFQALFQRLDLWKRLRECCAHLTANGYYSHALAVRLLVVHLLLGFKRLRDTEFYRADPMVLRTLEIQRMPSVSTISRLLADFDQRSVDCLRLYVRDQVLDRLAILQLPSLTLDFDGSVQSTKRHAEGTAVGFNKQHKGWRSYYPLFCTVAQSGQVLTVLHRSGNVHDSNGAIAFIEQCIVDVRAVQPKVRIEVRLDSAFFSDAIVRMLEKLGVTYTISVPFERFTELKGKIETRCHWQQVPGRKNGFFFEERWKPESWQRKARFVFIRTRERKQDKEPLQLDLFRPLDSEWQYKVIVTNKCTGAGKVAAFHEGRGYQEKILGDMKQGVQMEYIPCRKRAANEVWLLTSMLTHNLGRELQLQAVPQKRPASMQRTALWVFESIETLRRRIVQRAARLTRPQGKWTLTLPDIPALRSAIGRYAA
jgi:hypothetical protein